MTKTCPRCGSNRIGYAIMGGASTYVGDHAANWYACKDCGYTGPLVFEGVPAHLIKAQEMKSEPFFKRPLALCALLSWVCWLISAAGLLITMCPLFVLPGIISVLMVPPAAFLIESRRKNGKSRGGRQGERRKSRQGRCPLQWKGRHG